MRDDSGRYDEDGYEGDSTMCLVCGASSVRHRTLPRPCEKNHGRDKTNG